MRRFFNFNIGEPMHYDTTKEWLVDQHIDDWDRKMQQSLWYVADDSGLTLLDNVDFETANKYAYNNHGCNAYMKTD